MTHETAILAGGCFWGMQELLREYPGVISTRVGYSGGEVQNATYRNHGSHAEAVEIVFDPAKVSFRTLLDFFFRFMIRQRRTGRATIVEKATARQSTSQVTSRSALLKRRLRM